MMLLVGLGNPDKAHRLTRHNIGFMVIDRLCAHYPFSPLKKRFSGELAEGQIENQKIICFKPLTYMNLSGQALGEITRYFDISLDKIIVFYDEIDLPFGKFRLNKGGSASGHNGVKSCIAHIGADFKRGRLGVGHPGDKSLVARYVLSPFSSSETPKLSLWLDAICDHIGLLALGQDDRFANRLHIAMNPPE